MEIVEKLFRKKKKLIVGLMSGTSVDGIDALLVEVKGSGLSTSFRQLAFQTYPYPAGFKELLFKNSNVTTARLDDITRLNVLIAMFFADAAQRVARKAGKRMSEIDLIGSHGQTIYHLPEWKKMFGKSVRATLQLGSPSVIAKLTGVVTIGDFRLGDIAVGGSGAPLVPLFDYLTFRSDHVNRGVLNIGGIANITILPKQCSLHDVVAFDTGPGNMVIDQLMLALFNKPYDKDGMVAQRGRIIPSLLRWMYKHPYFKIPPPKSTGREMFGEEFIKNVLQKAGKSNKEGIITTASEFTALSIYQQYVRFIRKKTTFGELIVSGGGVHNRYIMGALQRYFHRVKILTTDQKNLSADAKEALCFALLANETVAGHPGNVTGATGARRLTPLGVMCLP
ncbi:MAG: anhydro-N-acetylmuramic acid kinase [Ignavibacteriae bacterium]|nr:anhydro-N-acetylmuramic acid kinase [Ignavibacteriota bacterium]